MPTQRKPFKQMPPKRVVFVCFKCGKRNADDGPCPMGGRHAVELLRGSCLIRKKDSE